MTKILKSTQNDHFIRLNKMLKEEQNLYFIYDYHDISLVMFLQKLAS